MLCNINYKLQIQAVLIYQPLAAIPDFTQDYIIALDFLAFGRCAVNLTMIYDLSNKLQSTRGIMIQMKLDMCKYKQSFIITTSRKVLFQYILYQYFYKCLKFNSVSKYKF